MKNADMPAMPIEFNGFGQYSPEAHSGLTKREMFAIHLMSSLTKDGAVSEIGNEKWYAERACALADALLKE